MDRYEKNSFVLALLLSLFFFGLVVYSAKSLNIDLPTCLTDVKPFTQGRVVELAPGRYQVDAVAYMWGFDPPEIKVPQGAVVDFYVTSKDVVHGLRVKGTLVNLMGLPGVVSYARTQFKEPGRYLIICHEYCGAFHHNMVGTVVVE